jgi:hypothetical protein
MILGALLLSDPAYRSYDRPVGPGEAEPPLARERAVGRPDAVAPLLRYS